MFERAAESARRGATHTVTVPAGPLGLTFEEKAKTNKGVVVESIAPDLSPAPQHFSSLYAPRTIVPVASPSRNLTPPSDALRRPRHTVERASTRAWVLRGTRLLNRTCTHGEVPFRSCDSTSGTGTACVQL